MSKETVIASSDVALIKYWGKKDEVLRLPENGSVSLILDGLDTITTVEFLPELTADQVVIGGESEASEVRRVVEHLDRIRALAHVNRYARVESVNTFPRGTGLSSSGSGFAALTGAATKSLGLDLSQKELSILARQGSGTACRCICSGIVEWKDGNTSDTSYSETLYDAHYFEILDVVAVVNEGKKRVSSTKGHITAHSSIFYDSRLSHISAKIEALKKTLESRDFTRLGEITEAEALEFHSILLTSIPSLIAWYPGTLEVMIEIQQMRQEGIEAYFTINTGFNVHVLTLPEYVVTVERRISKLPLVQKTLRAKVGDGPRIISKHLF